MTLDEIPCTSLCIRAAKTSLCAPVSGDPAFNFPVNDRIRCYCAQVGAGLCILSVTYCPCVRHICNRHSLSYAPIARGEQP